MPRGVQGLELFNERMKENSDDDHDNYHDNDDKERKSRGKWDGEFEGISRVAEEVATLWKLRREAKRERAMAIKSLSKR